MRRLLILSIERPAGRPWLHMRVNLTESVATTLTRRRLVGDSAFIALLAVGSTFIGLTGMWSLFRVIPVQPSALWSTAIALIGCLVLLGKARAPRLTFAAATALWVIDVALTGGGLGSLLVLLDALWTASYYGSDRQRRQMLAGVIALTLAGGVAAFVLGSAAVGVVTVMISIGALLGTSLWAATAVARARELAELQRRARAADAAEAVRERETVLQDERDAMARELHDVVAGHVSAVALRAEAALLGPPSADADRAALRAVRESSLQAHDALRSMITVLRDGGVDRRSPETLDAVPRFIADAERAGITVSSTIVIPDDLPRTVEQTAARVVREGLLNAVRHGDGDTAHVEVKERDGVLTVQVRSSGIADSGLGGTGWGLLLMEERVKALGGALHAGPEGEGWLLSAGIPAVGGDR